MAEIVETDGVLGGKPRVSGTRVSAEQVYEMYVQGGMQPKEIADILSTVDISDVKAAIAYMEDRTSGAAEADAVA